MRLWIKVSFLLLLLVPGLGQAWWNEEWPYRKKFTLDTTQTGAGIDQTLTNVPVLVRLSTAEFADFFYLKENVEDLRFIAADGETPLKHYVERFDLINQLLYVWVRLPQLDAGLNTQVIWMYYGNQNAVAAEESGGVFDVNTVANIDFTAQTGGVPQDLTAYGNNPAASNVNLTDASLIAAGAELDGSASIVLPDTAALRIVPGQGYTFYAWVKPQGPQDSSVIFTAGNEQERLELLVDQSALIARALTAQGSVETPRTAPLTLDAWQLVALRVQDRQLSVFIDGTEVAAVEAELGEIAGGASIGSAADGSRGFVGEIDQVQIANVGRPLAHVQLAARNQGRNELLVYPGPEEELGGAVSKSYFVSILQRVEIEGRIIILMLLVMAAISWVVMFGKAFIIARIRKDNRRFMQQFRELDVENAASLDHEEDEDERELSDSAFLQAMFGKHDHFQSSSLYRIYHAGIQSLKTKLSRSAGAAATGTLSPQSIQAIRAILEGATVREIQRLNNQMVLLTIAISGGPFLGLLGTVLGVMLTFAVIADQGDVNINAIAPGVAAALMTTVAGLFVAIPALFGYNYLSTRIRDMVTEMRVFVDEFIAKLAESHS